MSKPNYRFQKYQKELARKKKKEEKLKRKAEKKESSEPGELVSPAEELAGEEKTPQP